MTIVCALNNPPLQADTARVVWSWHSEDPADLDSIQFHEFMGSTSVNLLGGLNVDREDPPDTNSFIVRNENVQCISDIAPCMFGAILYLLSLSLQLTIPHDSDTTYWCSAFELPPEVRERERYIFKVG